MAALADRTAVVSGAASGIGRAIATAFAAAGARVALLDLPSSDLARVADGLRQHGTESIAVHCDVRSGEDVVRAFSTISERFPSIDILACAAGIREIADSLAITHEQWNETIAVDLSGTFFCCQAAALRMSQAQGGSIINVASVTGLIGESRRPAYTAAKHGVVGLTKALAIDLAPHGIRVNAICPGLIRTPLTESYFLDPTFEDGLRSSIPLGRPGAPRHIGDAAVFLAGRASEYITGISLPVDGGFLADKPFRAEAGGLGVGDAVLGRQ